MAIFVDIIFVLYTFCLVLLCGFFPRFPEMVKNAVLTLLGKPTCDHEEKPFKHS